MAEFFVVDAVWAVAAVLKKLLELGHLVPAKNVPLELDVSALIPLAERVWSCVGMLPLPLLTELLTMFVLAQIKLDMTICCCY